jgi:tRNA pseudouridine55 synthase
MASKQSVITLYKNRGETPLECMNRFKKDNPEYKDEKMTYAGRLDPLAEGILLVLVGEECKNREKYLGFDKEYEVAVLFGFATDSFDVLGLVTDSLCEGNPEANQEGTGLLPWPGRRGARNDRKIQEILNTFIGRFSQKYPPFSSKTVNGIPLFNHAKSGNLDVEDIPSKEVEIKSIELLNENTISKSELEKFVKESVALVSGDFRQRETLESWESALSKTKLDFFKTISIRVSCTSGTYMRSLANSIGEKVGIPALVLNIKRTSIGAYVLTK